MIGLDTNVLLRYLAQDDPIQSPIATNLIEHVLTEEEPGYVSIVAIVEAMWVMERSYRLTRPEIAAAIKRVLQIEVVCIEREQDVFNAMMNVKAGLGSFSDSLIGIFGVRAGCTHTVTFDRKALRLSGFQPIAHRIEH